MWWTGTRARDDTSPIRHFVGKCSRVRLCLFYPFCSASEIKCRISTLQKNLVMSQIIGRVLKIYLKTIRKKFADSDSDLGEIESQFEPYTEEPLAPPDYDMSSGQESDDPDRLSPQTLADREEGLILVQNWSVKIACCEFIVVIVAY